MNNQQLFEMIKKHYYQMRAGMSLAGLDMTDLDLEHDCLVSLDAWTRIASNLNIGGH